MNNNTGQYKRFYPWPALLITILFITSCAEVRLNKIPAPPASPRLRVFIQPITSTPPPGTFPSRGSFWTPHEEFANRQFNLVGKFLTETGIFELTTRKELESIIGKREITGWEWGRKDWDLARKVGHALHADYALITERVIGIGFNFFDTVLINLETGKKFKVFFRFPQDRTQRLDWQNINLVAYREIFRDAKNDLLATALRKSGVSPHPRISQEPKPDIRPAPVSPPMVSKPPEPAKPPEPKPEVKAEIARPPVAKPLLPPKEPESRREVKREVPPSPIAKPPAKLETPKPPVAREGKEVDFEESLGLMTATTGQTRLAVYDFAANEPFKVAALILAESLREEVFRLGQFILVNRENIVQVMNEMGLQQSGLVDEKQAVQVGKGLAVSQIILGQFGALGKTALLQVKRIDVETQNTLAIGSLKCTVGREEELLAGLTELVKKLTIK